MVLHVQILNAMGAPYETVNILESELLRQGMKEYSQWPTFPQVYIDGEFYGGCDIMIGLGLAPALSLTSCTLQLAFQCCFQTRENTGSDDPMLVPAVVTGPDCAMR